MLTYLLIDFIIYTYNSRERLDDTILTALCMALVPVTLVLDIFILPFELIYLIISTVADRLDRR